MRNLLAKAMQILSVVALMLTAAPAIAANNPGDVKTTTFQTTEYHTVSGWEKGLVTSNRNLGQYYWSPITSISHGSGKTCRQTSNYTPPVAQEQKPFHYIKPVQLPQACARRNLTPTIASNPSVSATYSTSNCQANLASKSVSAKLTQKAPRAIAALPATRVYAAYSSPIATIEGQPVGSNVESKDAYGRILRP